MINSVIIGTGSYLPKKVVTNDDIANQVETSNEWIISRTGIKQRHIVTGDDERCSDLATKALNQALMHAKLNPNDIDGIIVATSTPDLNFPSTAAIVQNKCSITKGFAFDVNAVCSGFIYALTVANAMLRSYNYKRIAVIGAEVFSKLLDWQDRSTCILFGDGAAAVILEGQENKNSGIIDAAIYSDGRLSDILTTYENKILAETKIYMNGREVYKNAVDLMSSSSINILNKNHLTAEEIDWILPHQANVRIMRAVAKKLNIPDEKVVCTVDMHANTSAASIPLALDTYIKNQKVKKGDLVMMTAVGAGITWGSALLRI